jgi:hypothetical protein
MSYQSLSEKGDEISRDKKAERERGMAVKSDYTG